MTGNSGGADNNISVTFDPSSGGSRDAGAGSAQQAQAEHMQTIDGKPVKDIPPIQSGAGEFYPVAGSTTKSGSVSYARSLFSGQRRCVSSVFG